MLGPKRLLGHFRSLVPASLLLALATGSTPAWALDKAAAEALFDQGVQLMKQKNFTEACPKLEGSQQFDPAVGTLLYLGECYERSGRTASAWATFREAASSAGNAGQQDRARVANARAKELEPTLSRLSVELAPEVAAIPGVVVNRGGQRLEPSLYGTSLPVDPGEYRVEVTAPGYELWIAQVAVQAGGGSASVRVPALEKRAAAASNASPPAAGPERAPKGPAAPKPAVVRLDDSGLAAGITTQQTIGLVVGAVGLVGFGVGGYFGVRAITRNSDAEAYCPRGALCDAQAGEDLTDEAQQAATLSNVAFGAGALLLATGSVLYLTGNRDEPKAVRLTPMLLPGIASASISGSF